MNRTLSLTLLCLLSAVACSDDTASETPAADAAVVPSSPVSNGTGDAAVPGATDAATPGTSVPPGSPAKIPLLVWVDDLVDNHTRDDAVPDTVDDKSIADDENPSAFDSRFK